MESFLEDIDARIEKQVEKIVSIKLEKTPGKRENDDRMVFNCRLIKERTLDSLDSLHALKLKQILLEKLRQ